MADATGLAGSSKVISNDSFPLKYWGGCVEEEMRFEVAVGWCELR